VADAEFRWAWCPTCECYMVRCPKCGMNSCSGGSGTLPDGSKCDMCKATHAYDVAHYNPDPGWIPPGITDTAKPVFNGHAANLLAQVEFLIEGGELDPDKTARQVIKLVIETAVHHIEDSSVTYAEGAIEQIQSLLPENILK